MKKFVWLFGLWTGILMLIVTGVINFVDLVPEVWVPKITKWAMNLVAINTFILTQVQGLPGLGDIKIPDAVKRAAVILVFLLAPLFLMSTAHAQAVVSPPTTKAMPYVDQSACTINQCTSWFVGAAISGNGTNADILGQGINQSVFAAGGIFDAHIGGDLWNGKYYAGVEAGIGYQFQSGPLAIGKSNLVGYQEFRLGGSLTGLINGAGAQSAITVPTALAGALMAPYLVFGSMERNGLAQWLSGAGAKFLLATNWDLYLEYMYGAAVGTAPAVNIVKAGLNRHFSL